MELNYVSSDSLKQEHLDLIFQIQTWMQEPVIEKHMLIDNYYDYCGFIAWLLVIV